jgi:hypothetical protein
METEKEGSLPDQEVHVCVQKAADSLLKQTNATVSVKIKFRGMHMSHSRD